MADLAQADLAEAMPALEEAVKVLSLSLSLSASPSHTYTRR